MHIHNHSSSKSLTRDHDTLSSDARRGDTLQYAAEVAQAIARASADRQSQNADARARHLEFRLGDANYALPLANVSAIELPLATTSLPFVPAWHIGIADLRGDIISVVDLRSLLGMNTVARTPSTRVVIVRAEETTVGLIVDAVIRISRLDSALLAPTDEADKGESRFVRGTYYSLVVLDAEELFRALTLAGTEIATAVTAR